MTWREEFYKVHPADKVGSKQKAFVRVHADLYGAIKEGGGQTRTLY